MCLWIRCHFMDKLLRVLPSWHQSIVCTVAYLSLIKNCFMIKDNDILWRFLKQSDVFYAEICSWNHGLWYHLHIQLYIKRDIILIFVGDKSLNTGWTMFVINRSCPQLKPQPAYMITLSQKQNGSHSGDNILYCVFFLIVISLKFGS